MEFKYGFGFLILCLQLLLKLDLYFSKEIDEPFVELTEKNESINKSLNLLSEQLNLHSEDKVKFEETIKRLKVELDRAMEISKASDSKVSITL